MEPVAHTRRLGYEVVTSGQQESQLTPAEAYAATPKAVASGSRAAGHFRLRYDVTDSKGAMTLRRSSRRCLRPKRAPLRRHPPVGP